ncbi:hypothetical protein [Flavobacterium sp. ZS1P14]|uniref:hypothetical protein n=1 Tax=Flavobacterium sp. ZS1P14 TaxID=3401729 RepID=UPI003AAFDC09
MKYQTSLLSKIYYSSICTFQTFTISYRDVEEIMKMRGVQLDHATIQRWVYKFSPFIEAHFHWNT